MGVQVLLLRFMEGSHNWQCTGPENRRASACESSNLSPSALREGGSRIEDGRSLAGSFDSQSSILEFLEASPDGMAAAC